MSLTSRLPLLLLFALAFGQIALHADPIYTNFDDSGSWSVGAGLIVTNDPVSGASVAVAFTPSDNYNLTTIEFVASDLIPNFSNDLNDSKDSNDVTVGIFADNGGLPGATPLESFNASLGGLFGGNILVTTVSSILHPLLLANTQYWIGMNAAPGDLIIWNQNITSANGFSETDGSGNWSAADPFQPQGVLEVDGVVANIPPVTDNNLPSSVPEPAVWTLMAIGLAALLWTRGFSRVRHRLRYHFKCCVSKGGAGGFACQFSLPPICLQLLSRAGRAKLGGDTEARRRHRV